MRIRLALAMLIGTASAAWADSSPVLVIPGRPGVPIIINGVDASYAVVEGDWGLAKAQHVTPKIYGGRYVDPCRTSVIIFRAPDISRALAGWKSNRPPIAGCRSPRKATINHGRRNRPSSRCSPRCPSIHRRLSWHRKEAMACHSDFSKPPDFRSRSAEVPR